MSIHYAGASHSCPQCRLVVEPCLIEDGRCDGGGTCGNCTRQNEYDRLRRREELDAYDYD